MNRQQLQRIEHLADSTKLATLMRLAKARNQVGWRYQQKTVEEWLQEAASLFGNNESDWRFHEISEVFEEIGIGVIPILIEALHHEEWRIRMSAASLLGMFGPDAITAVPALARALNDSKARVRRTVLKSLILIQEMPIFVLSSLLRSLRDQDSNVVALAVRAIACFGPAAEDALPFLCKELDHPSWLRRSGAAYALGEIGIARSDVVQALLEKVFSDDECRPAVIRALARLTPDILSQMLLDPNFTQPFHQTLLSLVPLGREAGPLFPALFDLYKSYWADPVILIVLSCVGYHAAEALPFMRKHYEERRENYEEQREYHKKNIQYDRNQMKETGESKDISLQNENYSFQRETYGGVVHMLHALRGILIDIFLEGERQRGVHLLCSRGSRSNCLKAFESSDVLAMDHLISGVGLLHIQRLK